MFNNISNVNTVNNNGNGAKMINKLQALRQNLSQSAVKATSLSSASDSTCLSFSLTRQYILYDTYRSGSEKKTASMILGQSPYTSPQEAHTVASTEEIDAELDKVKELFAAGFIQQGKRFDRLRAVFSSTKKFKSKRLQKNMLTLFHILQRTI